MVTRHYTFSVPVVSITTQVNPAVVATPLDPGDVLSITVVSPGVANTGVAIAVAHQIVIPFAGDNWIVSTGTSLSYVFRPEGYPASGQWEVFGYNTNASGVNWQVYYDVRTPQPPQAIPRLEVVEPIAIYRHAERLTPDVDRVA